MGGKGQIEPRWKKGESGNPAGRPKGSKNRSTIVKEILSLLVKGENPMTGEQEWLSNEYRMTASVLLKAIEKGDVNAYNSLMDSAYGKNKDTVDLNTSETVNHDFKKLISGIKFKQ
tara:strand:- start:1056 stop:1403 length:348 start_codon:yes stop_codon:yes gene_type:complete